MLRRLGCYASRLVVLGGLACIAAMCLHAVAGGGQKTDDVRDFKVRFREHAPAAWQTIRTILGRLQVKIFAKTTRDGMPLQEGEVEIRQNAQCKMRMDKNSLKPAQTVQAYNPLYSFDLRKEAPHRPWTVESLEMSEKGRKTASHHVTHSVTDSVLYSVVRLAQTDIEDLIKQPTFSIISVRPVQKESVSVIEVCFANRHDREKRPFCPIQAGTIYFDAARSWCIRSAVLDVEYLGASGKQYHDVVLSEDSSGSFIPRRWVGRTMSFPTQETKINPGKKTVTIVTEVDFQVKGISHMPGDQEFRLSAFGLPEPMGVVWEGNSSWQMWLVGGALAAGILMILFRHLKHQAAARKKPTA